MAKPYLQDNQDALRVLHCPNVVGGNPQELARAERELGLLSWSVSLSENYYSYQIDESYFKRHGSRFKTKIWLELKKYQLIWRALKYFDIIHYNFGQTILPGRYDKQPVTLLEYIFKIYSRYIDMKDLELFHRAKKGIVVTYQGDDARQGDYSIEHFDICPAKEVDSSYYSADTDQGKRRSIAKFDKYADQIHFLNPDLGWVLPKRAQFMPYAHINLNDWKAVETSSTIEKPIVLHAPSNRKAKGTSYIMEAVNRLKSEGVSFDFILVENLSNQEAKVLYEKADLLIDQLLAGWYGGLAVELMALGKPVICYIRESDLCFIPKEMRENLPIIKAEPSTIYHVLKDCLTKGNTFLLEIGSDSRKFVEKWHNPLTVATKLTKEYAEIILKKHKH